MVRCAGNYLHTSPSGVGRRMNRLRGLLSPIEIKMTLCPAVNRIIIQKMKGVIDELI